MSGERGRLIKLFIIFSTGILSTYGVRADVLKRFGPGYKVRMGFGLHIGWSIEGVLGTIYKIDASYLSSHVNMSGKLEVGCPRGSHTFIA